MSASPASAGSIWVMASKHLLTLGTGMYYMPEYMPEGRFHTVCHTCAEEHFSDEYGDYQTFFKKHADNGHDVEMQNLAPGDGLG